MHKSAHKVYENKLNQDFNSAGKRYNCTIIDLHDRSVVASITDRNITADLAKRTLAKAINSQPKIDLSKAGYPYDNAPMERYFNTLKNDLIYQHYYRTEEELYTCCDIENLNS